MATKNDITGDLIKSKQNSDAYSTGWDRIFGKKDTEQPKVEVSEKPKKVKEKKE